MLALKLFVISGIALLSLSLIPTLKICRNDGRIGWRVLFVLIAFFVIGYLAFLKLLTENSFSEIYLLISLVLFGGSSFVVLVIRLSLKSIIDAENRASREEYNALHDSLTGLPNRNYFFKSLKKTILLSEKKESHFAVLMIDLDRFKEINDTLGHYVGDKVLKEIGERFQNNIDENYTLARLGGDEFALIVPCESESKAIETGQELNSALESLIHVDGYSLTVDMSIGIAMFPRDGHDRQTLLKKADVAMYQAKHNQSDYQVYEQSLDQHSIRRLQLIPKIKEALENDDFELFYQPIIDAATNLPVGLEALIRWYDANGKFISPDEFIPLAEKTNYISDITKWVIKNALLQIKSWQKHFPDINVHVNLSALDVLDTSFPEKVKEMLEDADLPSSVLILEITESAMIVDIERVKKVLHHFKLLGISVSIDDFGTGFSSLSLLRELPTEEIKIDRSFVIDMEDNSSNLSIVRATIDLAHSINRKVIAEGVEDDVVRKALCSMNCDFLQGYYFCRPLNSSDIEQWLQENYLEENNASSF